MKDYCLAIDCKSKEYKKELDVAHKIMEKLAKVIKHYEKGIDNLKNQNKGLENRIQTLPNDTVEQTQQKMKNGESIQKNIETMEVTKLILNDIIEAMTEIEVENE